MGRNTKKWLNRLILPKSIHALILWAEREKESTLCLLFAQQPVPAGRHRRRKGASMRAGWGEMGGWCRDAEKVSRGYIVDFIFYSVCWASLTCTNSVCTHLSTHNTVWTKTVEAPRKMVSSLFPVSSPSLFVLFNPVLSESATKRTVKK